MIWFRKKALGLRSPHPERREELLAELPLASVADRTDDAPDTPYARFHAARAAVVVGDRTQARLHLHGLLGMPALSARLRLQAWSCLRELGEAPPAADADTVQGVVVDLGTADGLDTVAAYLDHSAHLIHHSGATSAVKAPDSELDAQIEALLAAGAAVVAHTDPDRGHSEHPPESGHACIRVLTLAGPHVGLGPTATLAADPVGGPVLQTAQTLRELLLARAATRPV